MALRSEIRTRARYRADQFGATKPDDTAYNYWLDEVGRRVWSLLLQSGWPIDYTTSSITANGAATYTIHAASPPDVAMVAGVYYIQGTDVYELKRVNTADIASLRSVQAASNRPMYYEIRFNPTSGAVIEFFPRPNAGTFEVRYYTDFTGFASDATNWNGPARTDELIAIGVAIKALRNEGDNPAADQLEKEWMILLDEIQHSVAWLDARSAPLIRDAGPAGPNTSYFDYPVYVPGVRW